MLARTLAVVLVAAAAGCGSSSPAPSSPRADDEPMSRSESTMDSMISHGMEMPEESASAFGPLDVGADWASYTRVSATSFPSPTHGGRMVDVYVNDVGLDAYLAGADTPIPVGTVVVKTSVEKSGEAGPIFVMEKREPGFDADHEDWWYAIHWADPPETWRAKLGGPIYWRTPSPRAEYCSDCHDSYDRQLGGVPEDHLAR